MRILYHSAPPLADTGYGVHTKHLAPRLDAHWDVDIQSVAGFEGMGIDWEGIQIYPAGAGDFGQHSIPHWYQRLDADVVFSHHDHWSMCDDFHGMQQSGIPTVLYTVLDNELPGTRPPEPVVQACEESLRTVVMSKWAKERTRNSRIPDEKVVYVPHAVNTKKFAPVTDPSLDNYIPQTKLKREMGIPEDAFLFGMVAANYGPRKNIPMHMEAFSRLVEEDGAEDAYFYIHAHPKLDGGFDLYKIRSALGLSKERMLMPDPHEMYHGLEDLLVVQLYNTFDVHCNVTQSESWGLTVTEAMSSGTPVIAANNSAMTEQLGVPFDHEVPDSRAYTVAPNGLLVDRGVALWTQGANAKRYVSGVDDIYEAMKYAYENRDEMEERGANAREFVQENYEWDTVFEEHWKPLFEAVEDEVTGEYNKFYFERREQQTQSEAFSNEADRIRLKVLGDRVLDAGCGTGALAEYLHDHGYDVVAADHAEAAVEWVEENRPDLEVYQEDIRALSFPDDAFDTAIAQHVLEHVEADAQALAELYRVATERAVVVVPEGGPHRSEPDPTEVRRYTEEEFDRLEDEFYALTGTSFDYERIWPTQQSSNWMLTIDAEETTVDAADEDDE